MQKKIENGDKLPEEDKTKLNEAIEKAKKDVESTDVEVVKKATEELTNVANDVFARMYQNASANAQSTETKTEEKPNDGDPEVVVDDDNNNQ